MLRIDALCGLAEVQAPIPDGISVLAAERWLLQRFENERCVLLLAPGLLGTATIDFDLDTYGTMPADYQRPMFGPTYQAALRLGEVEIQTTSYFDAVRAMKMLESVSPVAICSAAGGRTIFGLVPTIMTGIKI